MSAQEQQKTSSAIGNKYLILYSVDGGNTISNFKIIFEEDKGINRPKADDVHCNGSLSYFTCICPPGDPLFITNFIDILSESEIVGELHGVDSKSVIVQACQINLFDDTKTIKEVAGFTNKEGKVISIINLLTKNSRSEGKNFFEALKDVDNGIYLDIKIPQPSPSALPPPPKMEGSDEMKTPPQKMLETTRQMSEKEKEEL